MNPRPTLVLLSLALFAAACNGPRESEAAAPKPPAARPENEEIVLSAAEQAAAKLEIRPVETSSAPETLRANGRIALADDKTWHVGVRTDGIVVEVYAGLGDYVKKGAVLARYHADEVRESRAQYRAAASELDRAKAAVAQAARSRDRAQRLLDLKAGSAQQVEQAQQDVSSAEAAVRKAEIEIDRTRDVLEDDLRVPVEPKVDDPLADDVPILAPAAGYVIEKDVTPGRTVERARDTFVLADLAKVWMLASIRAEDLAALRTGQMTSVTLPGDAAFHASGRITNLGQRFDSETRQMQIRIELNNPNNRLRPEMLAVAEIPSGAARPRITAPSDAIQQINGQDVVFVKTSADRFVVRPVRTGETSGGRARVLEGVKPGEQIVVHGSFALKSRLLKSTLESE